MIEALEREVTREERMKAFVSDALAAKADIEEGRAVEADLTEADLAGGFMLGNSARGLIEARLALRPQA